MLILAGLPPETVMEICASAIQFYQNQTSNELHLMEEKLKRMKSRVESVKEYYEGVIEQFKVEINTLEDKLQCQAKSSSSCSILYSALSSLEEDDEPKMMMEIRADINNKEDEVERLQNFSREDSFDMNITNECTVFDSNQESSPSFLNLGPDGEFFGAKSVGEAGPYRLVKTEITEENKVIVNGQDVMRLKRHSILDHVTINTKTTTRSAQASYNQLPFLLLDRLVGKNKSSSNLDVRARGSNKPYSKMI